MPSRSLEIIITCEHATHAIPPAFRQYFVGASKALKSHRGYDPGASELARTIANGLHAPYFEGTVSRLLVELNRSIGHPNLWSEFTKPLSEAAKDQILNQWYRPFRERIESLIRGANDRGHAVLHLSVHTFTPILAGQRRHADIGLLYDPSRQLEKRFCKTWKSTLTPYFKPLGVRCNYPYRGTADGFTTDLRSRFGARRYIGIELEVNQARPAGSPRSWRRDQERTATTLGESLRDLGWLP